MNRRPASEPPHPGTDANRTGAPLTCLILTTYLVTLAAGEDAAATSRAATRVATESKNRENSEQHYLFICQ